MRRLGHGAYLGVPLQRGALAALPMALGRRRGAHRGQKLCRGGWGKRRVEDGIGRMRGWGLGSISGEPPGRRAGSRCAGDPRGPLQALPVARRRRPRHTVAALRPTRHGTRPGCPAGARWQVAGVRGWFEGGEGGRDDGRSCAARHTARQGDGLSRGPSSHAAKCVGVRAACPALPPYLEQRAQVVVHRGRQVGAVGVGGQPALQGGRGRRSTRQV